MLSFLKEGRPKPASNEAKVPTAGGQESLSPQENYLTVAGHGKKLKQSTTLLIALFVVGTAGVWMMIRKAVPSQAAAAQKKDEVVEIETAVAQLNGMQSEVSAQMKSVTARLNHLSKVGQIAVEDLRKNPFTRDIPVGEMNADNPVQKQFLEEQMRKKATGLELQGITASPHGACCMINDKVLYPGDVIEGFSIKEIRPAGVVVEQNGIQVELKME
jgi:hypothetical protein